MKNKLPLNVMRPIARYWLDYFAPYCQRLEVAGSLRRCCPLVGDLELVAVPHTSLYQHLDEMLAANAIRHSETKRWGQKQRVFLVDIGAVNGVRIDDVVQIDFYLQPDPRTWGVNFMLRTGSAEFSHKMVTRRKDGGFMPDHYRMEDALVKVGATVLPTPEEEDVFRLWGIDYVMPAQRVDWYQPKFGPLPEIEWEPEPEQASLF